MDPHRTSPRPPLLEKGGILQDRYVIDGVLGTGPLSCVYLARHQFLADKMVAIKEMPLRIADPIRLNKSLVQFEREARLLASLDHPGVVHVIDYFKAHGAQYLVMEYIDGRALSTMLPSAPQFLEIDTVLDWADQICEILEFLHSRNPPMLFRDLRPSNIMIDSSRKLHLIDFGLARTLVGDDRPSTYLQAAGGLEYIPKEQMEGRADIRSDIYAIGATLYCLLTNSPPPEPLARAKGKTRTKIKDSLVPPKQINPAVPGPVNRAVLHMLALGPRDRPQKVRDAQRELHEVSVAAPSKPPRWVFEEGPQAVTMRTTMTDTPRHIAPPPPAAAEPRPSVRVGPRAGLLLPVVGIVVGIAVVVTGVRMVQQHPRPAVSSSPVAMATRSPRASPNPSQSPSRGAGTPRPFVGPVIPFGSLKIMTDPGACVVTLDGKVVGKSPTELVKILAGPHQVGLSHAGREPASLAVVVVEGQKVPVTVSLDAAPVASASPATQGPQLHSLLTVLSLIPSNAPADGEDLMRTQLRNTLDGDGFTQVDVLVLRDKPSDTDTEQLMQTLKLTASNLPIVMLVTRKGAPDQIMLRQTAVRDPKGSVRAVVDKAHQTPTNPNMMVAVFASAPLSSTLVQEAVARRTAAGFTVETLPVDSIDPDLQRSTPILQHLGLTKADLPCIAVCAVKHTFGEVLLANSNMGDGVALMSQLEDSIRNYWLTHK